MEEAFTTLKEKKKGNITPRMYKTGDDRCKSPHPVF